jgi:hypothetical protein
MFNCVENGKGGSSSEAHLHSSFSDTELSIFVKIFEFYLMTQPPRRLLFAESNRVAARLISDHPSIRIVRSSSKVVLDNFAKKIRKK